MQDNKHAHLLLPRTYEPRVGDCLELKRIDIESTGDGPVSLLVAVPILGIAKTQGSVASSDGQNFKLEKLAHEIRNTLIVLDYELRSVKQLKNEGIGIGERARQRMGDLLRLCSEIPGAIQSGEEVLLFPQTVSFRSEMESFLEPYAARARNRQINFEVSYHGTIPGKVSTDMTRLRQILSNLIENSLRHTGKGSIKLSFACRDKQLRILVSDSGEGIAQEILSVLFRPFQSSQRKENGIPHGLGLSTARQLARSMGGDVLLIKTSPGWGTIFEVQIEIECPSEEG